MRQKYYVHTVTLTRNEDYQPFNIVLPQDIKQLTGIAFSNNAVIVPAVKTTGLAGYIVKGSSGTYESVGRSDVSVARSESWDSDVYDLNTAIEDYYNEIIKNAFISGLDFKTTISSKKTTINARFNDLPLGSITLITHEKEDQFIKQTLFPNQYGLILESPDIRLSPGEGYNVLFFNNKPTIRGLSRVFLPYNLDFEGKIKELDGFIRCSEIGYASIDSKSANWLYPEVKVSIYLRYV